MLAFLRLHGLHACSIYFLMFPPVVCVLSLVDSALSVDRSCSTSSPGGNLVDGLPPAANGGIVASNYACSGSNCQILIRFCTDTPEAIRKNPV